MVPTSKESLAGAFTKLVWWGHRTYPVELSGCRSRPNKSCHMPVEARIGSLEADLRSDKSSGALWKPVRALWKPTTGQTSLALFLVIISCSSYLLQNTHLVPTIFCFGLLIKNYTLFLLKLLSSSCMATTQYESRSASSTLKGLKKKQTNNIYKKLQYDIEWLSPSLCHQEYC
jgi:hypothetical protein